MTQSVVGVYNNLLTVCTTLYPAPVLVTLGDPGNYQPDIIVAIVGGQTPVARPTMGTGRSREKTCAVEVVISVYVPGGDPSQQSALVIAEAMADALEAYLRVAGQETLGGSCREAWVTNNVLAMSNVVSGDGIQTGTAAEITVTVQASIRI